MYARTLLDEVKAICEPLGAKPTLAKAEALADRLANGRQTPLFPHCDDR